MNFWIGTSGFRFLGVEGELLSRRFADGEDASRFTPSNSPRRKSTTPSTAFPQQKTIENWKAQTPKRFRFALKAAAENHALVEAARLLRIALEYFCKVVTDLGERLGPVLFQFWPTFKKDADMLSAFLRELPVDARRVRIPSRVLVR